MIKDLPGHRSQQPHNPPWVMVLSEGSHQPCSCGNRLCMHQQGTLWCSMVPALGPCPCREAARRSPWKVKRENGRGVGLVGQGDQRKLRIRWRRDLRLPKCLQPRLTLACTRTLGPLVLPLGQFCRGDAGGGRGQREPLQTHPALPCPTGEERCVSTCTSPFLMFPRCLVSLFSSRPNYSSYIPPPPL